MSSYFDLIFKEREPTFLQICLQIFIITNVEMQYIFNTFWKYENGP